MNKAIKQLFDHCDQRHEAVQMLKAMQNSSRIRLRANIRELRILKRMEKDFRRKVSE